MGWRTTQASTTSLASIRPILRDLLLGERDQFVVGRVPQAVALEAEILEAEAAHARSGTISGDHERKFCTRPTFTARIVDVDPVVGEQVGLVDHQRDGEEVAVAQRCARADARSASA